MIHDQFQNSQTYEGLSPSLKKAFDFIRSTNLDELEDGRHEIDGDNVFALAFGYTTKLEADCITEAHFAHIDVHYIISGAEIVGQSILEGQIPTETNQEKDYAFYKTELNYFKLDAGKFAVFFPHDIHLTGKQEKHPIELRKLVIKIKV